MAALVPRWLVVALALSFGLSSCGLHGLSFFRDDRLSIVSPEESAEVQIPFEVRWTVRDFDGLFAVFFDRSPMPSTETVHAIVPDDDPCRFDPECPDERWLRDRNIYITDESRLLVDFLPDRRDNDRSKDRHDVTIVFLDKSGRRVGEAAFTREFFVDRSF